jgi:hypothetical protein
MRLLLLAFFFGSVMHAVDDITIPLQDGSIVIRPQFIRVSEFGSFVPELSFRIQNRTSCPWVTIKLQFDIGGLCNGEPRQWSIPAVTSLGWWEKGPFSNEYKNTVISLIGKVDGCATEIIRASLVSAESPAYGGCQKLRIDGVAGEPIDLGRQLQDIKTKREAEEAASAEQERIAAEAQAKKDAAEAARRKRAAAERKKKEAEAQARYAKTQAEEQARAAEERTKIRAACALIYKNTADMKIKDLTVKEEQQVRACQALGLYPPQ